MAGWASCAQIKGEGVRHLARVLTLNSSLQHLSVAHNLVEDVGVRDLATTLRKCQSCNINYLDLQCVWCTVRTASEFPPVFDGVVWGHDRAGGTAWRLAPPTLSACH